MVYSRLIEGDDGVSFMYLCYRGVFSAGSMTLAAIFHVTALLRDVPLPRVLQRLQFTCIFKI